MTDLELDIRENAIDSLNEGLRSFEKGLAKGGERNLKFAILNLSHFVELYFKAEVAECHPLLMYEDPSKENVTDSKTINVWKALQILRNDGIPVSQELYATVERLRKLRNQIEHSRVTVSVEDVKDVIGKTIRDVEGFADKSPTQFLRNDVAPDCLHTYDLLAEDYDRKLKEARQAAEVEGSKLGCELDYCRTCGEDVVVKRDNVFFCHACGYEDKILDCLRCGTPNRQSEMNFWSDEHGEREYMCDFCEEHIRSA